MAGLPQASHLLSPASATARMAPQPSMLPRPVRRLIEWTPLSQPVFRQALIRERKRADRFEDPFVLALVSLDRRNASHWPSVIESLSRTTIDPDLVGWYEDGAVLGILRAVDPVPGATAAAAAAAIHQEFLRCLTTDTAGDCSVHLEVYSPHTEVIPTALFENGSRHRSANDVARDAGKRLLDIAGSAACLVAFSPVFLSVSAMVKLSSKGPVFFRQMRVGKDGQLFPMLKFRTMHVNCDPAIHQQYVESFIQARESGTGARNAVFKIVNDPRVTRVGHFLRRSSLDEFPQFWNVLKGEMSLVGPRPPLPYEVAKYKQWHRRRLQEAKPGITGLWQVTGRSRTTFDEMVRLDLRYARSHSVWTDLKILLNTPRAVLSGKGAH